MNVSPAPLAERRYDVLVVGTGPGGIGAACRLTAARPGLDVAVVEAGRAFRRRPCPVDAGRRCNGCGGTCNVVSGFGGSMHYGDGVKLSLLPSGRRLIDQFGEDVATTLGREALELLEESAGVTCVRAGARVGPEVTETFAAHDLTLREYPVAVLPESALARAIETLDGQLRSSADLLVATELVDLVPTGHGYLATLVSGAERWTVATSQVVLATGRRGLASTQRLLARLGVQSRPPSPSAGVRLEMQSSLLEAAGVAHPDLKISHRSLDTQKIKTFCFCGGVNGGRIKFTNYHGVFDREVITLDGHETCERVPGGRELPGNFGLLAQLPVAGGDVLEWVGRHVIDRYERISGCRPVAELLGDFLDGAPSRRPLDAELETLPFEPSVRDLIGGAVHELFDDEVHASLVKGFETVMPPILELAGSGLSIDDLRNRVLVVGLELEFLWDEISISEHCETSLPGLYVVGDAAGVAQGILQAMAMGFRAGDHILQSAARS